MAYGLKWASTRDNELPTHPTLSGTPPCTHPAKTLVYQTGPTASTVDDAGRTHTRSNKQCSNRMLTGVTSHWTSVRHHLRKGVCPTPAITFRTAGTSTTASTSTTALLNKRLSSDVCDLMSIDPMFLCKASGCVILGLAIHIPTSTEGFNINTKSQT